MKPTHLSLLRRFFFFGITLCVTLLLLSQYKTTPPTGPPQARNQALPAPQLAANYGQVPLSFEANHGQAQEPVQYLARGTNASLYLTPTEAVLEVRQPRTQKAADSESASQTALVKMKLLGANPTSVLQ